MIMKPHIFGCITDFFASGLPLIQDPSEISNADTQISDDDDEVVAMIKELIETRIRGFVQVSNPVDVSQSLYSSCCHEHGSFSIIVWNLMVFV